MNFDARKDYRQAVKFYNSNVAPKPDAEGHSTQPKPEPGAPGSKPEEPKKS